MISQNIGIHIMMKMVQDACYMAMEERHYINIQCLSHWKDTLKNDKLLFLSTVIILVINHSYSYD